MNYNDYKRLLLSFSSLNNILSIPGNDVLLNDSLQGIDQALSILNNGGADSILEESQERADKGLPERVQVQDLRLLLVRYREIVDELFGDESSPLWSLSKLRNEALFLDSSVESLLRGLDRFNPGIKPQPGRPGRKPGKRFFDCITLGKDSDELRKVFSDLIKGKKGKDVARVIRAGKESGILVEIPSVRAIREEFGDVGSDSNLSSFLEDGREWRGELQPIIEILRESTK